MKQKKDNMEMFSIDRWESEQDHKPIREKMVQFSKLSKQRFYHFDTKPVELEEKIKTIEPVSKNPKPEFEKTRSNLLNPLETKTTRLHPNMKDASVTLTVRQKPKRNLSFEFYYFSHHQNESSIENLQNKKKEKIKVESYTIGLPKISISEEQRQKRIRKKAYFSDEVRVQQIMNRKNINKKVEERIPKMKSKPKNDILNNHYS